MNPRPILLDDSTIPPAILEPLYCVALTVSGDASVERRIRQLIERKRGDLKSFSSGAPRRPDQVYVQLGVRRIDDVVAALEGAGFEVDAIVATH